MRSSWYWTSHLVQGGGGDVVIPQVMVVAWEPPPRGCLKVNYDGAVFVETNEGGIGVVIRDDQGLPMISLSQKIPYLGSSIMMEVLALRRALLLAIEMGFQSVILEGDSEIAVKAVTRGVGLYANYGHIMMN
jgi:hypothetical protein